MTGCRSSSSSTVGIVRLDIDVYHVVWKMVMATDLLTHMEKRMEYCHEHRPLPFSGSDKGYYSWPYTALLLENIYLFLERKILQ